MSKLILLPFFFSLLCFLLLGVTSATTITTDPRLNFEGNIAIDKSGNIYAADMYNSRVVKIDSNGHQMQVIPMAANCVPTGRLPMPTAVALDSTGNLYVALSIQRDIFKFNTNAITGSLNTDCQRITLPTTTASYSSMVVDDGGYIYLPTNSSVVSKLDSTGAVIQVFVPNGQTFINGIAVDTSGNVYITTRNNQLAVNSNSIIKFNAAGKQLRVFQPSSSAALSDPRGIAVDSIGNMYVADYGNRRVVKFDGNGNRVDIFSLDHSPYGIAIYANNSVCADTTTPTPDDTSSTLSFTSSDSSSQNSSSVAQSTSINTSNNTASSPDISSTGSPSSSSSSSSLSSNVSNSDLFSSSFPTPPFPEGGNTGSYPSEKSSCPTLLFAGSSGITGRLRDTVRAECLSGFLPRFPFANREFYCDSDGRWNPEPNSTMECQANHNKLCADISPDRNVQIIGQFLQSTSKDVLSCDGSKVVDQFVTFNKVFNASSSAVSSQMNVLLINSSSSYSLKFQTNITWKATSNVNHISNRTFEVGLVIIRICLYKSGQCIDDKQRQGTIYLGTCVESGSLSSIDKPDVNCMSNNSIELDSSIDTTQQYINITIVLIHDVPTSANPVTPTITITNTIDHNSDLQLSTIATAFIVLLMFACAGITIALAIRWYLKHQRQQVKHINSIHKAHVEMFQKQSQSLSIASSISSRTSIQEPREQQQQQQQQNIDDEPFRQFDQNAEDDDRKYIEDEMKLVQPPPSIAPAAPVIIHNHHNYVHHFHHHDINNHRSSDAESEEPGIDIDMNNINKNKSLNNHIVVEMEGGHTSNEYPHVILQPVVLTDHSFQPTPDVRIELHPID